MVHDQHPHKPSYDLQPTRFSPGSGLGQVAGILYSPCPWAWHQFGIPPSVVSTVGRSGGRGVGRSQGNNGGPPVDSFDFCIFFFCENLGAERHWIVLDEILLLSIMKL